VTPNEPRARDHSREQPPEEDEMSSVARVIEISAQSSKSFEDAIDSGLARAEKTLRNVTSAWVKEQRVDVKKGKITGYQVNLLVTFILD
jgi:flavin-binding protein dodecin